MLCNKAYHFRLKVRSRQEQALARYTGCCRFIWNKLLGLQKERMGWDEWTLNYAQMCEVITAWKALRYPWLEEAPSQALQQVARDLDKALKRAFNPEMPQEFPVFKQKGKCTDSFRIPQGFKWDKKHGVIEIPKLGRLKYFSHSDVDKMAGKPTQVTISRRGKHWYVSIGTEQEVPDPTHPHQTAVGIDLGVVHFAVLSNGEIYAPSNSLKDNLEKLARAQRAVARKVRFSQNWRKQQAKVASIHIKIANCRDDHTSKVSTAISNNHAYLVMENLKVVNLTASAAGAVDDPGKNVAAKAGLNRSILDQGWGDFRRKLQYKEQWRGGNVILVPPHGTSQECPLCGHKEPDNRKDRDTFHCLECGYLADADLVASINILRRGTPYLPAEAKVAKPMKQEPIRQEKPARGPSRSRNHRALAR